MTSNEALLAIKHTPINRKTLPNSYTFEAGLEAQVFFFKEI